MRPSNPTIGCRPTPLPRPWAGASPSRSLRIALGITGVRYRSSRKPQRDHRHKVAAGHDAELTMQGPNLSTPRAPRESGWWRRLSRPATELFKVAIVCLLIYAITWVSLAELGAYSCVQQQAAYREDALRGAIEYGFSST